MCSRILFSSLFSPFVNVKGFLNCGGMLRGKHGLPLLALLARSRPLSHHWAAGGLLSWIRLLTSKHLAIVFPKAQLAWRPVPPTTLTTSELNSLTKLPPTGLLVPPFTKASCPQVSCPQAAPFRMLAPPSLSAWLAPSPSSDLTFSITSQRGYHPHSCFFIALVTGELLIYFCHPCT